VIVDPLDLRTVLMRVCRDAGIDAGACVVWVVDAERPPGATPIAYLQPAGEVRADTVLVFRAVGAERAGAFAGSAHRFAIWRELPGLPEVALGPMLRHELAHAARWELSGALFYAADERLRAAAGSADYEQLPTEREANAAAGAYARTALTTPELAELATVPELAAVLAVPGPPADVVGETLTLLGEVLEVEQLHLEPRVHGPLVEVVAPAPADGFGGMR
jgi:hypothetical protein